MPVIPNPNKELMMKEHTATGVRQTRVFATEVGRWFDERAAAARAIPHQRGQEANPRP
jgi:hypothetical protein